MSEKSDFGLIGLAVMGQNLVLNVESRGFRVSVYNRTTETMEEFVGAHPDKNFFGLTNAPAAVYEVHESRESGEPTAPPAESKLVLNLTPQETL